MSVGVVGGPKLCRSLTKDILGKPSKLVKSLIKKNYIMTKKLQCKKKMKMGYEINNEYIRIQLEYKN